MKIVQLVIKHMQRESETKKTKLIKKTTVLPAESD